ncbi:hypothetical protein B4U80_09914 [Leptotrombidium deliense]|uniref:Protein kinase domain-containing protein n=1 Tax=Leptotrombidium deliense TaxID=299467 RepID=A0A443SBE3_9ACAR|nr:hypothetical protein B4U80_09914 [Leptotrombidium deliense]
MGVYIDYSYSDEYGVQMDACYPPINKYFYTNFNPKLEIANSTNYDSNSNKKSDKTIMLVTSSVIFTMLLLLLFILMFKSKRKKDIHADIIITLNSMIASELSNELELETESFETKRLLPKDRLIFKDIIATGCFSVVHRAEYIERQSERRIDVAVKCASNAIQNKILQEELSIILKLGSHVNIISLIGADNSETTNILLVLNTAKMIVHRDLAARNVLLDEYLVIKICDFGLSKQVDLTGRYVEKSDRILPIKWMAIEAIEHGIFSEKSDVWSLGIVLWEIFTFGKEPYNDSAVFTKLLTALKNGCRLEKPVYCTDNIYAIMKQTWNGNAKNRPTFCSLKDAFLVEMSATKHYTKTNI